MKIKIIVFTIVGLALIASSCSEDFLYQSDPNQATEDIFWRNEADAIASLNAGYSALNFGSRWNFFECGWGIENWKSDEILYGGDYPSFFQVANFTNTPEVWEVETFYKNGYQFVNRANQSIEGIPQCDISDSKITELVSEAKFLRAYGYFKLIRNFRYLPLHTKTPTTSDELYVSQVERSVVWELIEEDLLEAVNNLPSVRVGEEVGRATSGAAAAFLGYAYLFQEKYAEAKTILSRIENGDFGGYDLLPMDNYSDNWNGLNENNQESLFEIQMQHHTWSTVNVFTAEFLSWQEANASSWIFDLFESEQDLDGNMQPRYYHSMISPDEDFETYYGTYWGDGRNMILKHVSPEWSSDLAWENNYPLMRYADVLLMLAEAVNEVDGPDAAREHINRVRQRANMPDIPAGLTKEQFRESLMKERALELCFEGRRWYDLVRWHEAGWINIEDKLTANGKQGVVNFNEQYLYYPIPEAEYETNPNAERSKQW